MLTELEMEILDVFEKYNCAMSANKILNLVETSVGYSKFVKALKFLVAENFLGERKGNYKNSVLYYRIR